MSQNPHAAKGQGGAIGCNCITSIVYAVLFGIYYFTNPDGDVPCCAKYPIGENVVLTANTKPITCPATLPDDGSVQNVTYLFKTFFLIMFIVTPISVCVNLFSLLA